VKIRYEYRFLLLIATLAILVGISGYHIYTRISGFVNDVRVKIQPDEKVLLLQKIKNDLVSAENQAYNFTLTEDEKILDQYKQTQDSIQIKLTELEALSVNSDIYARSTRYMSELVNKKFAIMDTILVIQDNYRVNRAFTKMLDVINEKPTPTSTPVKVEEKKEGVFRKLFSKKKNQEEVAPIENENLNKEKLSRDITLIKQEESFKEISNNEKLLNLKEEDTRTMQTINNLMGYLQHQSQLELERINQKAKKEAKETNYIVAIFVIVAIILLGFVFYVVYDYVKYSRKYNALLIKSKKQSDEMAEAKSRFLATMSHEIRTPMNAILGFSDLLIQSEKDIEQKKRATIIHNSAEFLVRLINDTLELSRLNASKIEFQLESTNIRELINEISELFQNLSKEKNNILEIKIDKNVKENYLLDPYRLKQVLINLIGNSCKFTQDGSIELEVNLSDKNDLVFTVSDSGIGMTQDQQKNIFNEFEQADNNIVKQFGGSGLGLPITKKIIDQLKGSIKVKSELNKGSKFIVTLPLKPSDSPVKKETGKHVTPTVSEILKDKSVLIADDEIFNRKLVTSILQKHQCKIVTVENGLEALNEVNKHNFDIVLMDIHMPEMDGLTFIKSFFKSEKANQATPILALTAFSENIEFYLNLGFSDLLRKPFNENELINKMENLINNKTEINHFDTSIDLISFKEMFSGNKEFYFEMLETFISSTEKGIKELNESIETEDYASVKEVAHRIAPPCTQIRATALYELLKKIENQALKLDDKKEWISIKEDLNAVSDSVLEQVRTELSETNE